MFCKYRMYHRFLQITQQMILQIHLYHASYWCNKANIAALCKSSSLASFFSFALLCGRFCKYNSETALLQSYLHQLSCSRLPLPCHVVLYCAIKQPLEAGQQSTTHCSLIGYCSPWFVRAFQTFLQVTICQVILSFCISLSPTLLFATTTSMQLRVLT